MNPIEVEVIGFEPLEAGLQGAGHVLAVIPAGVGVPFTGEECVFGGDDKVVSIGFKEFTEERLASALVVFVGGVDEIAPGRREAVKDFLDSSFDVARPQSRQTSPKVIVPRQSSETRSPLFPSSL